MKTAKLKPAKNLLVRDPKTRQALKVVGEDKPLNTYWLRRLRDKSVVKVTTKATTKTVKEGEA